MLKNIDRFINKHFPAQSANKAGPDTHHINLATACLLIEVMRADHDISDVELETIRDILAKSLALNENEISELITLAEQQADKLTSYHPFTTLINKNFDLDDKTNIMMNMWQVALSDHHLDKYEEHLIRKVAGLIYVPRDNLVASRRLACKNLGLDPGKQYRQQTD